VKIVFSDDTIVKLYYEDTLLSTRASQFYVYATTEDQYNSSGDFTHGGVSSEYDADSGSGVYFFTDFEKYSLGQPVIAKMYYDVQFVPNKFIYYPDDTDLSTQIVYTTSPYTVDQNQIFLSYTYRSAGVYYPYFEVRSSSYNSANPSTFKRVYFGDGAKRSWRSIEVTQDGFGGMCTHDGIFGLSPQTFALPWSSSTNIFLKFIGQSFDAVIQAVFKVMSDVFCLIQSSPPGQLTLGLINPPSGSTFVYPTEICFIDFCQELYDIPTLKGESPVFTIAYADEEDYYFVTLAINVMFLVSILGMTFRALLFHK